LGANAAGRIVFTNIPQQAVIKLYDITGVMVRSIEKNSHLPSVEWNLKNDGGKIVASGVYIYIIKSGTQERRGKVVFLK
jgi:hypothetical protein